MIKMHPKGLFFKIFIGLWLMMMLFALTPIIFFLVGSQDNRTTFYNIARKELEKNLHRELRAAASDNNLSEMKAVVKKAERKLGIEVYVFDKDRNEIQGLKYPSGTLDLLNEMKEGNVLLIKKVSDSEDKGVIRVIRANDYTLVSYPNKETNLNYLPLIFMHHMYIMIHIIILSSIASLIIVRFITKPLMILSNASRKIADGDFSVRVSDKLKSRDEIGSLAKDFDIMTAGLQKNREDQESMLRNISHELRSPLTRLRLSLELARAKANETLTPSLDRIEKESERLNSMIGQLLDISRMKESSRLEKSPTHINEITSPLFADCGFEARENGKQLILSDAQDVTVNLDRRLIISALENIVRNAIKYAADEIIINVRKETGYVIFEITDDGEGVPEEMLADIFTPFYRIQSDRDRKTGGTGLGLAIAKAVIEAHHGRIYAENCETGLRVTVFLPL